MHTFPDIGKQLSGLALFLFHTVERFPHVPTQRQHRLRLKSLAPALTHDHLVYHLASFAMITIWLKSPTADGVKDLLDHRVMIVLREGCGCCGYATGEVCVEAAEVDSEGANAEGCELFGADAQKS